MDGLKAVPFNGLKPVPLRQPEALPPSSPIRNSLAQLAEFGERPVAKDGLAVDIAFVDRTKVAAVV